MDIPFFTGPASPAHAFKEALRGRGVASKADKKAAKEEREEYEFDVPDFDEDAFIHREMVGFRTTSILFVVGIVAALLSWAIFEAMDGAKVTWLIGLAIMAAATYSLKLIYPALNVDIRHFGRREWFGTAFLTFFAWLSFFILFINPPISDHADPTVAVFASPSSQLVGGDVTIDLFVADNYRVETFAFQVFDATGGVLAGIPDLVQDQFYSDHHSIVLESLPKGSYNWVASATDGKGSTNSTLGAFVVSPEPIQVLTPDDGSLDRGDEVFAVVDGYAACARDDEAKGYAYEVSNCVLNVLLRLDDGETVVMDYSAGDGAWQAKQSYTGWTVGNNSFHVEVQFQDRFHGIERVDGGRITMGPYWVEVPQAGTEVDNPILTTPEESPITVRTPGFGLVAGVGVLLVAAVVARRRQQD